MFIEREKEITKHNIRINLGGSLRVENILLNAVQNYTKNPERKSYDFFDFTFSTEPNDPKQKNNGFITKFFMAKMSIIFTDSGS